MRYPIEKILKGFGIVFMVISLAIGAGLLWFFSGGDNCDKVVAKTANSSDGKWTAVATQEECGGAAGGIYYLVDLKGENGESVRVLDVAPIDSNAFDLKWTGPQDLEIQYPGSTSIDTKLDSYNSVKITYIDTHKVRH